MLIVVSKVRKAIKEREDLSMSLDVSTALSNHVESVVLRAAVLAKKDGRKTVMRRDVDAILNGENNGRADIEG